MDIQRRVGRNVRRLRRERGLSQEELGFEADLYRTYISGVERGIRNPTLLIIEKIAAALGTPPHTLLEPVQGAASRRRDEATS